MTAPIWKALEDENNVLKAEVERLRAKLKKDGPVWPARIKALEAEVERLKELYYANGTADTNIARANEAEAAGIESVGHNRGSHDTKATMIANRSLVGWILFFPALMISFVLAFVDTFKIKNTDYQMKFTRWYWKQCGWNSYLWAKQSETEESEVEQVRTENEATTLVEDTITRGHPNAQFK